MEVKFILKQKLMNGDIEVGAIPSVKYKTVYYYAVSNGEEVENYH